MTFFGIIFLLVLAIVLAAISLGFRLLQTKRTRQVSNILSGDEGGRALREETKILMDPRFEDPLGALLNRLDLVRRLAQKIQQAGLPWSPAHLLLLMLFTGAIGVVLGAWLRPLGFQVLSAVGLAGLLGWLPYAFMMFKRRRRFEAFEQQFPEALDFIAASMRAGHAFSISLEMLSQELPEPIGMEFRTLFNEQNLGAPLDVALTNLATRVPLLDVKLFVSSVTLQKQTGGNLSEILTRLAFVIRERFRLRGQVRAASAHGRLTAAVLTLLPLVVVIALLIIAPGYLQAMANDPDGKWMILGAILAQIAGYVIMRRIINIKV